MIYWFACMILASPVIYVPIASGLVICCFISLIRKANFEFY
jgi:hypothetical protein